MAELCSKQTESNCWCKNCVPELHKPKTNMLHELVNELFAHLKCEQDAEDIDLETFKKNWLWQYCDYDFEKADKIWKELNT